MEDNRERAKRVLASQMQRHARYACLNMYGAELHTMLATSQQDAENRAEQWGQGPHRITGYCDVHDWRAGRRRVVLSKTQDIASHQMIAHLLSTDPELGLWLNATLSS